MAGIGILALKFMDKLNIFNANQIKNPKLTELDLRSGDTVKVYQKIKDGDKERIQVFEGVVIAKKHGKGINATFTVRKISDDIGVERIFPLHAPFIEKIEITKRAKVRRSKLYYLRNLKGKKAKLKQKQFEGIIVEEEKPVISSEEGEKVGGDGKEINEKEGSNM
jgi:large subunit ribosomal protein L19